MRKLVTALMAVTMLVTLSGCGDDNGCSPTSPCNPPPPDPPASNLVVGFEYTVSTNRGLAVRLSLKNVFSQVPMENVGGNLWRWEGTIADLEKLQSLGVTEAVATDDNRLSSEPGFKNPGYPIRSYIKDLSTGEIISSDVSSMGTVTSIGPDRYGAMYEYPQDNTVKLVPGPGIPSSQ